MNYYLKKTLFDSICASRFGLAFKNLLVANQSQYLSPNKHAPSSALGKNSPLRNN